MRVRLVPKKTTVYLIEESAFFAILLLRGIADRLTSITRRGTKTQPAVSFPHLLSAMDSIVILLLSHLSVTELRAVEIDLSVRHAITFDAGLTFEPDPSQPPGSPLPQSKPLQVSLPELVDCVATLYLMIDLYFDLADLESKDPTRLEAGMLASPALQALALQLSGCILLDKTIRAHFRTYRASDEAKKVGDLVALI